MDFCTHEIGTTISCNQVESDGFEAVNLLQKFKQENNPESTFFSVSGNQRKQKGFMVDYFVKPPVTLKLRFPLCINISHIVLSPKVGKQESSAFLLQTEIPQNTYNEQLKIWEKNSMKIHIIGKEYINSTPIPELLVFRNPRFFLREEYHSLSLGKFEMYRNFQSAFELKHPAYNACENVSSLEITILRSTGSTAPALGLLQVWGQPFRHCSKLEIQELICKFGFKTNVSKRMKRPIHNSIEDKCETPEEPSNKTQKLDSIDSEAFIPEEFLDPITCEVMCQPMRLPSGIAIDFVTLEKFTAAEAQWGRPSKDPFTGKCFSDKVKPLPDPSLKSRIDSFLTKHSEVAEVKTLPRTIGRLSRAQPTSSVTSIESKQPLNVTIKKPDIVNERENSTRELQITKIISSQNQTLNSESDPNPNPTENLVSQELARILKDGTSYLTKSSSSNTTLQIHSPECLFCKIPQQTVHTSMVAFYKSTCGHIFLCRNCIVSWNRNNENTESGESTCTKCSLQWKPKDLFRIHT